MRRGPRAIVWTVVIAMSLITVVQLMGMLRPTQKLADAKRMLYEASLFQVELLSGFIGEAANVPGTEGLNALKQAAYSVEYTHGRLVQAWGSPLPELHSVPLLMEFMIRLQIGGGRKLKPEEAELFAAAAPHMQEVYEAYAVLVSPDGQLNGISAARVKEADEAIVKLLTAQVK
jgi:hypothetical protein